MVDRMTVGENGCNKFQDLHGDNLTSQLYAITDNDTGLTDYHISLKDVNIF